MANTNNSVADLLGQLMQTAVNQLTQTDAADGALDDIFSDLELDVEDSSATARESIEVVLQGQVKRPTRDTLTSLVGSAASFSQLRQQLFQSTSARGTGVSVTMDGDTTIYSESDRIPGAILDATELRISYSVESGRNG